MRRHPDYLYVSVNQSWRKKSLARDTRAARRIAGLALEPGPVDRERDRRLGLGPRLESASGWVAGNAVRRE